MRRGIDVRAAGPGRSDTVHRALIRAFGLFRRAMAPYFARFGLSGSQWGVLRVLHRAHEAGSASLRLSDVSERLLIQPPSVTGAIDRLHRMGLVTRSVHARDQRVREVRLTPRGLKRIEQVLAGHRAQVRKVLAGLDRTEQAQLHLLLDRLSEHMHALIERGDAGAAD